MNQFIEYNFDEASLTYDEYATMQSQSAATLCQILWNFYYQSDDAKDNPQILEIGCGTGIFSEKILKRWPNSQVNLLDISSKMLNVCQEKLTKIKNKKIFFTKANIENYHIKNHYDIIVSAMSLQWLENIEKVLLYLSSHCDVLVFSLPTAGSLSQWYDLCHQLHIPYKTGIISSDRKSLASILAKMQIHNSLVQEKITIIYENALSFVRHLKKTGAYFGKKAKNHDTTVIANNIHNLKNKQSFAVDYIIDYHCLRFVNSTNRN